MNTLGSRSPFLFVSYRGKKGLNAFRAGDTNHSVKNRGLGGPDEPSEPPATLSIARRKPMETHKALVIDDEQIVLDSVSKILREEDYRVEVTLSGR